MFEALVGILFAIVLGIAIVLLLPELGWLLMPIESGVRWVQRVVFGIDRPKVGYELLIGGKAIVLGESNFEPESSRHLGMAKMGNELWSIRASQPFSDGQTVTVVGASGAILDVVTSRGDR